MLPVKYEWEQFRKRTDIRFRSRGSNMEGVDNSLKAYWDSVPLGPEQQIRALFELLQACNSWLKTKKDKNQQAHKKTHFQTRWDAVKDLANAAFAECQKMMSVYRSSVSTGQMEYERKKLRSTSAPAKAVKALAGGYAREREMWLKSNKTVTPISGTSLTDTIAALTDANSMSYDDVAARKFGTSAAVNKSFDQMTIKDWQAIEVLMGQLSIPVRQKHVAFLKKADRIAYMAIPRNGLLTKNNGTAWDTGSWELPYAMDEYGNMFIGEDSIVTVTDRLNHSSLLAGKDVLCAGTLKITAGRLTKFNNNSGHYKPTGANVYQALLALLDEHVDLSRTSVLIISGHGHGFDNLTVDEVIAAKGVFTAPHPKYY